jgi:cellulose synthase/poly-beta-1,6-N-acetylglucosamine synthase-like glycosyltransferase
VVLVSKYATIWDTQICLPDFRIYRTVKALIYIYIEKHHEPVPIPKTPTLTPYDVSVIVSTIDTDPFFEEVLQSWLVNSPFELIIVTTDHNFPELQNRIAKSGVFSPSQLAQITLLSIPKAGKRKQLTAGIQEATGSIIVLADDDTFWPSILLPYVLACFENPKIGGVGTREKAYRPSSSMHSWSFWHEMSASHLLMRNNHITANNWLGGSVPCLSGHTAAYRASILKDNKFLNAFTSDLWRGKYLLDQGDDTFLTRWLMNAGWEVKIQTAKEAIVEIVVLNEPKHLRQITRSNRNSQRSFIRFLTSVPNVWK